MSQWNCSRSKAYVCRAVCGRALSGCITIPRGSLPLRLDNLTSHRPAENEYTSHLTVCGILNRHSHGHSYLCTYQVTRSDIQLLDAISNITEDQKPMIGCNKTGARTVCAYIVYFLDGPCINEHNILLTISYTMTLYVFLYENCLMHYSPI